MTDSVDQAPLLERIFDLDAPEMSVDLPDVRGELPRWLVGDYYLNGPSRFRRGDRRYRHWLDGDGRVTHLGFTDGSVRFTSRYVRSVKYTHEEEEDRFVYRAFGTAFPDDELIRGMALASPVNVSAYRFAGRLLALGEQGLPWSLDPETLETQGEHDFGRLSPVTPFSAHPHFDPDTGEMYNFGVSFSAKRPMLQVFRFGTDGEMISRKRIPLEHPYSMHDFSLSSRHVAFLLAPYLLDMRAMMGEGATVQSALRWRPELGTTLRILDRDTGEDVASLPVGNGYSLHHIQAFEEDGTLTVDLVELPEPYYPHYQVVPDLFIDAPAASIVRRVVDLERQELVEERRFELPWIADFPAVDPRLVGGPYRDVWMLAISATGKPGRKFFDRVFRFDMERGDVADSWASPSGTYLGGEPVFAPDPDREGHGAVICQAFDAEKRHGRFLVFDGRDLARGPIAELPIPEPIPLGFHASFDPKNN